MKILVISQYFWPENFKINDLCLGLREKGHDVEVLTGIPNYPTGRFAEGYDFFRNNDEVWNGIKIHRARLVARGSGALKLILNYLSFAFFASAKGRMLPKEFDCILVYEPSPITVGIPAVFIGRKQKIPILFWVQDLWPESLSAAGNIHNKTLLKTFDVITKWIYKNSTKVLVQSEGFRSYIQAQGVANEKIIFYPNSTENFYVPTAADPVLKSKLPDGFLITFAGNFGESQSLHTILHAALELKNQGFDEIKFVFLGDGRMKTTMVDFINNNGLEDTVHLLGAYPAEEMPKYFGCSDVLISSLKKDRIFSLTIPSKIQSYLASGKPILASMDGEGARIIEEAQAGLSSPAEDVKSLTSNIIELYKLSDIERRQMANNARCYFEQHFERNTLLDKLIEIFHREVAKFNKN